jgi:hypothetical protein
VYFVQCARDRRTKHKHGVHDLYFSTNVIPVNKLRIMGRSGHVKHTWERRGAVRRGEERRGEVRTGFRWGNLREWDHLEDLGVDVRILKWTFKKWDGEAHKPH